MNILVCIGIVPDTTSKLVIDSATGKIDKRSLTMIIGPYDDYALSKAIEIKEQNNATLSVVYVGDDASAETLLRKSLAIGADEAFQIKVPAISSKQVATEIIHFAQKRSYDLILMGKESIDSNNGLVHRLVGNGLNFNHFSPVMQLDVLDPQKVKIHVEVPDGTADYEVFLPAVFGCQEPIAEWKIPSMRGIMMARTKPLTVIDPLLQPTIKQFNDQIIEKNRLKRVYKLEDTKEIADIINNLIN
ncbi:MAG: hypothetical protein RJA76_719 [Bacteroidota bacterium]|jgi:electron transfer flavoprotein beta subunit